MGANVGFLKRQVDVHLDPSGVQFSDQQKALIRIVQLDVDDALVV